MKRNLILAALVAAAMPAAAATNLTLGLTPGYAIPVGPAGKSYGSAFMLGLSGELPLNDSWSAGLELAYTGPNLQGTSNPVLGTYTSDINTKVWQITPFARYSVPMKTGGTSWTPYGIVGAGVYSDKSGAGTIQSASLGPVPVAEGSNVAHIGFNIGVGAMVDVQPNLSVGLELRYHHYFTTSDVDLDSVGSTDKEAVQLFVPSARVTYKFGS